MKAPVAPHKVAIKSAADLFIGKVAGGHRDGQPDNPLLIPVPAANDRGRPARSAWAVFRADSPRLELPRIVRSKIEGKRADLLIRHVDEPLFETKIISGRAHRIGYPLSMGFQQIRRGIAERYHIVHSPVPYRNNRLGVKAVVVVEVQHAG